MAKLRARAKGGRKALCVALCAAQTMRKPARTHPTVRFVWASWALPKDHRHRQALASLSEAAPGAHFWCCELRAHRPSTSGLFRAALADPRLARSRCSFDGGISISDAKP